MRSYKKARPIASVIGTIACLLSCVLAATRDGYLAQSVMFGLAGLSCLSNTVKYFGRR